MNYRFLCAVLLLCAPALRAQPSQTASVAEDRLRAWLSSDVKVREKISKVQDAAAVPVETDLKDAVADRPADSRGELLARLPGLQPPRRLGCEDFVSCSVPPLVMDVPASESVETAVRAMLRPWIWLADARGARLGVAPAGSESSVLAMNVQGLGITGAELNMEAKPEGGVHLWFSRGLELAEIYSREREAVKIQ